MSYSNVQKEHFKSPEPPLVLATNSGKLDQGEGGTLSPAFKISLFKLATMHKVAKFFGRFLFLAHNADMCSFLGLLFHYFSDEMPVYSKAISPSGYQLGNDAKKNFLDLPKSIF